MSGRYLDLARRARDEEARTESAPPRLPDREPEHPCLACGQAADERTLYCASCWTRRRGPRRLLPFDLERRARTTATMMERYCSTCGFSFWRVTPRGDSSCYACDLIREGRPLRCAACGCEEWRRDEHGRRACATCAGGDARVAAPPVPARPEAATREIFEERGAS